MRVLYILFFIVALFNFGGEMILLKLFDFYILNIKIFCYSWSMLFKRIIHFSMYVFVLSCRS